MGISRREFLRVSGTTSAGAALAVLAGLGFDLKPVQAAAKTLRIKNAKAVPGVCPYCAVGCAQLIYVADNKIIDIEGDPDCPHTEGRKLAIPKWLSISFHLCYHVFIPLLLLDL